MKKVLVLMLCVFATSVLFAQTSENKKATFQLSFVPPLSTNGEYAYQYTNKVSLNLVVGISRNEEILTWGGVSNIILNDAKGLQLAGLSNYIGNEAQGVQMAGLANISSNTKGAQFSGLINIAKDVNGAQFAGLINIAKNVKGAQFAGLINIAENSDFPIGLVNIIKNGEKGIGITYDALGSTVVSFRSGGKYTYGILGVGYNHKTDHNALVAEGGLGIHIPVTSWFRINNEIKASGIGNNGHNSDKPILNGGYSLIPAFKLGKHFELFAGASINYMISKDVNNDKVFPKHSLWEKNSSTKRQQLYIGYQVGFQYLF